MVGISGRHVFSSLHLVRLFLITVYHKTLSCAYSFDRKNAAYVTEINVNYASGRIKSAVPCI